MNNGAQTVNTHAPTLPMDRVLRMPDVMMIVGLKKTSIYMMMQSGQFPASLRLGARSVGWRSSVINQWLESRQSTK